MTDNQAIRAGRKVQRLLDEVLDTINKIRDEHPRGEEIYAAFDNEGFPVTLAAENVVMEVIGHTYYRKQAGGDHA